MMDALLIGSLCLFGVLILHAVTAITYYSFGWFKWLYHDLMGWHTPNYDKGMTFDIHNVYAHCKHCGKEISQDSQGNWYLSGGK